MEPPDGCMHWPSAVQEVQEVYSLPPDGCIARSPRSSRIVSKTLGNAGLGEPLGIGDVDRRVSAGAAVHDHGLMLHGAASRKRCGLGPLALGSTACTRAVQTDAVQTDRRVSAAQTDAVQTNAVRTDAVQTDRRVSGLMQSRK